jgi:hypothetical protein
MNRRSLLKRLIGVFSTLPFISRKNLQSSPVKYNYVSPIDHFSTELSYPLKHNVIADEIFQPIIVGDKVAKFPLDFHFLNHLKTDFCSYAIPGYNRLPERYIECDSVTVPTFDLAFEADTKDEAMAGIYRKLNDEAAKLLYYAAVDNGVRFTAHSEAELKKYMVNYANAKRKQIDFVNVNDYIIGLLYKETHSKDSEWSKFDDYLVMPVREDFKVYDDKTSGGYYSYGECGLAVLNGRKLFIGKVVPL